MRFCHCWSAVPICLEWMGFLEYRDFSSKPKTISDKLGLLIIFWGTHIILPLCKFGGSFALIFLCGSFSWAKDSRGTPTGLWNSLLQLSLSSILPWKTSAFEPCQTPKPSFQLTQTNKLSWGPLPVIQSVNWNNLRAHLVGFSFLRIPVLCFLTSND